MKEKIRAFIIHALGGVTEAEADARTPYYATNIYWPPRPEEKDIHPVVLHASAQIPAQHFRPSSQALKALVLKELAENLSPYAEFSGPERIDADHVLIEAKIAVLPPGWDS